MAHQSTRRLAKATALKTPEQVRAELRANGIKASDKARELGVKPFVVFNLLYRRCQGHWGESHRVAVALGLKADPTAGTQ